MRSRHTCSIALRFSNTNMPAHGTGAASASWTYLGRRRGGRVSSWATLTKRGFKGGFAPVPHPLERVHRRLLPVAVQHVEDAAAQLHARHHARVEGPVAIPVHLDALTVGHLKEARRRGALEEHGRLRPRVSSHVASRERRTRSAHTKSGSTCPARSVSASKATSSRWPGSSARTTPASSSPDWPLTTCKRMPRHAASSRPSPATASTVSGRAGVRGGHGARASVTD